MMWGCIEHLLHWETASSHVPLPQEFDTNKDGVLDKAEFEKFVRPFLKGVTYKVIGNVVVFCAVVPTIVFLTRAALLMNDKTEKLGKKIPPALLACAFSSVFKITGIFN